MSKQSSCLRVSTQGCEPWLRELKRAHQRRLEQLVPLLEDSLQEAFHHRVLQPQCSRQPLRKRWQAESTLRAQVDELFSKLPPKPNCPKHPR